MRNLKKILALVLVLVMTMSVMTFAGAYSDVESNDPAIEVMEGIGVMAGYPDGTFKPGKTLTREEAMKIVAYLDLTKSVADTLPLDGGVFTDVEAGRWSAGYIAYAFNTGVVDGNTDGTFGPEDELTGYAFAKMILNVLGIEGEYTGMLWVEGVKKALNDNKELLAGLEKVVLTNPMTRAQAAQLAFNALWYNASADVATGKYEISVLETCDANLVAILTALADAETFASSLEGILFVSNVVEGAKYGVDYKVVEQYAPNHKGTLAHEHDLAPMVTTVDAFGVETYSYVSETTDKEGKPVATHWEQVETGRTFADDTMTGKDLHAAYVGDAKKTINVTVYTNGTDNVESFVASKDSKAEIGGKGVVTTVYETATGLKVVEVETFLATVVEVKEAVKDNPKTEKDESEPAKAVLAFNGITDVIETESYKVEDYLLVTAANDKVMSYEVPDVVPGKMVGYKGTTSVTLDNGKTLEWAKNSVIKSISNYKDELKFLTDGLYAYGLDTRKGGSGDTSTPVDGYAKVLSWQVDYDVDGGKNDLFGKVDGYETAAAKAEVQFKDGTVEIVDLTVTYVDKKTAEANNIAEGYYVAHPVEYKDVLAKSCGNEKNPGASVWASYRLAEDGTYTFCAVEGALVVNAELKGDKNITIGEKTYRLNSATKYFEWNDHEEVEAGQIMVGYNKIATAEKTDLLVFINEKTNVVTEIYGIVEVAPEKENTDVELEDLYYAVKVTDEGNVYGMKWIFTVNGDEVEYYVDSKLTEVAEGEEEPKLVVGGLYELTLNDKNVVIGVKENELTEAGKVEFIDELYFDAANGFFDFADEYAVYNVETGAEDTLEVGDTASVLTKTVKVGGVEKTVVVMIFVEKAPKEA